MNSDQYIRQLIGDIVIQLAQALAERDAALERVPVPKAPKAPPPPKD